MFRALWICIMLLALAPHAQAAEAIELDLYPSSGTVYHGGVSGLTLALDVPEGPAATATFSAIPPLGDSTAAWYLPEAFATDVIIEGDLSMSFTLSSAVQVLGQLTFDVVRVDADGVVEVLGSQDVATVLSATPRAQEFTVALDGSEIPAGSALGIHLGIAGTLDVLVSVDHNDAAAASGAVSVMAAGSGEVFGAPGAGGLGSGSGGADSGDDHPEGVVASIFILAVFAIAGFALLRRPTP